MMFTPKSLATAVVKLNAEDRRLFEALVETLTELRTDEPSEKPAKRKYTRKAKAAAKDPNRPKRKYTRKAKPDLDEKFPKNDQGEAAEAHEANDAA